jgi:hypothetical protein
MRENVFAAIAAAAFLMHAAHAQTATARTGNIAVNIDSGKTGVPISPYIYGQFIEHIGDLANRSLWAEMLDDRKFYNDINSKPGEAGPGRGGRGFGRGGRQAALWRPRESAINTLPNTLTIAPISISIYEFEK